MDKSTDDFHTYNNGEVSEGGFALLERRAAQRAERDTRPAHRDPRPCRARHCAHN